MTKELTALKLLEELVYVRDCAKTKMPPEYVPKTKFTDLTANGLTKAIITWIEIHGGLAERISSSGRYLQGKTVGVGFYGVKHLPGKFIPGNTRNGTFDVAATINGKSLKIEVKIGKDRMSNAQKKYFEDATKAGAICIIARNFEQFVNDYSKAINE